MFATLGIHLEPQTKSRAKAALQTNPKASLKAKVDTGAQGNILPLRLYRMMYPQKVDKGNPKMGVTHPSSTILTAYGGSRIHHYGRITIGCEFRGKRSAAQFYITDTPGPAIIGLPTSIDVNLVKLNCALHKQVTSQNETPQAIMETHAHPPASKPIQSKDDLIEQYPNCFNGIGKFEGEYHITIDPLVPPVIPISLKDDTKKELDEMVSDGIIIKIKEGEPTRWVNSLVYRRKQNGRLRLRLDPKDLNTSIQRVKKAKATKSDPFMALLCLRATPIDNDLPSPAELLHGRPIQDNLPKKTSKAATNKEVTNRLLQRQAAQKYYHDRNTKPLPILKPGQSVNIQYPRTKTWEPADVKEKVQEAPRSYIVTRSEGREMRRNRTQLRKRPRDPKDLQKQQDMDQTPIHCPNLVSIKKHTPTQHVAAEE